MALARCRRCGSDLTVRIKGAITRSPQPNRVERKPKHTDPAREGYLRGESDGHVYCSDPSCSHDSEPHPTGPETNEGPVSA